MLGLNLCPGSSRLCPGPGPELFFAPGPELFSPRVDIGLNCHPNLL